MTITNWELLIGLIGIAIAIFTGLFFGLGGFRRGITNKLIDIENRVVAIGVTAEKVWDIVNRRFEGQTGTVERQLKNIGKITISAEPATDTTLYTIEIEKPILHADFIVKVGKETELVNIERKMFGKETGVTVFSERRMRLTVPSINPKLCAEYMTAFFNWLDTVYFNSLLSLRDYEEPILA